jgi:hypothetical protein
MRAKGLLPWSSSKVLCFSSIQSAPTLKMDREVAILCSGARASAEGFRCADLMQGLCPLLG